MKIYTKTGDDGTTGLFGGARVRKDDARVSAYGTIDELNSILGVVRSEGPTAEVDALLVSIQNDLFVVGSELACVEEKRANLPMTLVGEADVAKLEQAIDRAEADLAPLANFILPGGSKTASGLHVARTVCRRAEREMLSLGLRTEVSVYINRLSDLLFVLARFENKSHSVEDVPWAPRKER